MFWASFFNSHFLCTFQINSPLAVAADTFKNTLIEAEAIKYKLEAKEEEIKELKKHLKFKAIFESQFLFEIKKEIWILFYFFKIK